MNEESPPYWVGPARGAALHAFTSRQLRFTICGIRVDEDQGMTATLTPDFGSDPVMECANCVRIARARAAHAGR